MFNWTIERNTKKKCKKKKNAQISWQREKLRLLEPCLLISQRTQKISLIHCHYFICEHTQQRNSGKH